MSLLSKAVRPMGIFLIPLFVYLFETCACLRLAHVLETFFVKTNLLARKEMYISLWGVFSVGPHLFLHSIEKEAADLMKATVISMHV